MAKIAIFLWTFLIVKLSLEITGNPSNPDFDYYTSMAFLFNSTEPVDIYQVKQTSNGLYYFAHLLTTDRAMIYGDSPSNFWGQAFDVSPVIFGFDVAPDITSLAFFDNQLSSFYIYRINATNGFYLSGYSQSSFGIDSQISQLTYAEDSSSLFFISYANPDVAFGVWLFSAAAKCITYALSLGYTPYNAFYPLSKDIVYVINESTNSDMITIPKIVLSISKCIYCLQKCKAL